MTQAELEEDALASYLLAVVTIGEQVRAGLRELPPTFVPTRRDNHDAGGLHKEDNQVGP